MAEFEKIKEEIFYLFGKYKDKVELKRVDIFFCFERADIKPEISFIYNGKSYYAECFGSGWHFSEENVISWVSDSLEEAMDLIEVEG